ncbi:C1 family peptidase [Nodosilinea sp. PGN35]|uniref:C1 family peptidase n=1 Tax=Nodosilinea sp. PGN35 TaxID=3020489 RepID=UPI0023B20875|nr:C1 family peptidase [Nodosilinea sp. TSF1-S3]MDF0367647.1 C1 family peptidase [Nodosilinea sp. TSF1-S3]
MDNLDSTFWQNKGFGWIPDLPDISDPSLTTALNHEIRILTQESTGYTEEVADDVINLLEEVRLEKLKPGTDKPETVKLFEPSALKKIRQKLLGETFFPSVKVYKSLRKGVPSSAKQLSQLKQAFYLIYLISKPDLQKKLNGGNVFLAQNEMTDPDKNIAFIQWLQKAEFDSELEGIVIAFQQETGLHADGIVGLKTYTKLRYLLSKKQEPEVEVDLLCPSTLIPSEILEEAFNHLTDLWIYGKFKSAMHEAVQAYQQSCTPIQLSSIQTNAMDAIQLELQTFAQRELIKARHESIKKFRQGVPSQFLGLLKSVKDGLVQISKSFDALYSFADSSKPSKERIDIEVNTNISLSALIEEKIQKILADNGKIFKESFIAESHHTFIEQFEKWFSIIEPLVSAFLQLLSPLANFDNLKQAVETGFARLDSCFQLSQIENRSKLTTYKTLLSSYSPAHVADQIEQLGELRESVTELLWEALLKIDRRRNEAHEKRSTDEISFSFFGFLENILDCRYGISLEHKKPGFTYPPDKKANLESLLTAKRELFEIDNDFLEKERKTTTLSFQSTIQSSQGEVAKALFLEPVSLQLPINGRLLERIPKNKAGRGTSYFFLPGNVDLSYWFPPIKDQGGLNACTAFAGIALLEYFAQRRYGRYINLSPRFLYKVARNLMNRGDDLGASVRQTMKALVLFGVPPEEAWPWQADDYNEEPSAFCYAYAQSFQSLKYFRLDAANLAPYDGQMDYRELLLFQIKAVLAAGLPCMFGFTIYSSFYKEKNIRRGYVAYPSARDQVVGGHAAVAVGYNDYKVIERIDGKPASKGAILIRNSWGTVWGDSGYGWLPYDYVLGGLTADWWSLLKSEWFDGGAFGLGAVDPGGKGIPKPTTPPPPPPTS